MEKKTSKNFFLIIMGVLVIFALAASFITLSKPNAPVAAIIFSIISLVFAALYGFWLYKKPHGNLLKLAMLLFSISMVVNGAYFISLGFDNLYIHIVRLVAALATAYGAGRLNRNEENKILFPIIDIVLVICTIISLIGTGISRDAWGILDIILAFSGSIVFTTLMIAYFVRYKEHKEAGLMDASKK